MPFNEFDPPLTIAVLVLGVTGNSARLRRCKFEACMAQRVLEIWPLGTAQDGRGHWLAVPLHIAQKAARSFSKHLYILKLWKCQSCFKRFYRTKAPDVIEAVLELPGEESGMVQLAFAQPMNHAI